jgi:hypothetical protein
LTISDLDQPQEGIDGYLAVTNSLSQAYFDYVASNQDDSYEYPVQVHGGKGRAPGIHASEMSQCLRLVVYSILNVERKSDPASADVNMLMRFALGTAVHSMVQNDWHRIAQKTRGLWVINGEPGCSMTFEDEVKVHPGLGGPAAEWDLHSACDGIFTFWNPQGAAVLRVGLEIKTESDKQYEKLREPRDYHKEQTTLYMAALDLPLMWTFYYNKSNSNITSSYPPYLFQFDYWLWNTLEMRFAKAHAMATTGQLPERTEGMPCKWCAFSHTCQPAILKGRQPKRTKLMQGMVRRQR